MSTRVWLAVVSRSTDWRRTTTKPWSCSFNLRRFRRRSWRWTKSSKLLTDVSMPLSMVSTLMHAAYAREAVVFPSKPSTCAYAQVVLVNAEQKLNCMQKKEVTLIQIVTRVNWQKARHRLVTPRDCEQIHPILAPRIILVSWAHKSEFPPSGIWISSAIFSQYIRMTTTQTDRHTDHAISDICCNRPHLCYACDAA